MRKILIAVAVVAGLVLTACASDEPAVGGGTGTTGATGASAASGSTGASGQATAASCAQQNAGALQTSGTVTIGTDNPAYPPYFEGGTTKDSQWKINDPNTGKGFESAVGYEIAKRMGFSSDQVTWVVEPFKQAYAPGAKNFDFDLNQVSYSPDRAQAVDFSESYYDVNQALVVVKDTPITSATSVADLAQYTLGAPLGTTSYTLIQDYIGAKAAVYQTLADSVAALNAKQIDGIVVDLPTALYIADPYVQEVKDSTVLAQFPNDAVAGGEHFGAVLPKGSALTQCVDLALQEMKADGTLQSITDEWLSKKTNVGEVPVFSK